MKSQSLRGAVSFGPVLKMTGFFLVAGLFLLVHVWVPVQAERIHIEQRRIEIQLARRKSELDEANARYAALTSLPVLDQWAKKHGPWVNPNGQNVIAIEE